MKEKKISIPIRVKPIPASPVDLEEFEKQIAELIKLKLIRTSSSPWSSPAFMVRNHAEIKRGKARLVINFRRLNECTEKDAYRFPHKDSLFLKLGDSKFYIKFDCKSGFYQVKMEEASIPYTAFSTPIGNYEWLVMPFGLQNAPSIFQRKMDAIMEKHSEYSNVYIDDIIAFSKTQKEHMDHLKAIAIDLRDNGIIISESKAELNKTRIEFLGCEIQEGSIILQPHVLMMIFPKSLARRRIYKPSWA